MKHKQVTWSSTPPQGVIYHFKIFIHNTQNPTNTRTLKKRAHWTGDKLVLDQLRNNTHFFYKTCFSFVFLYKKEDTSFFLNQVNS